MTYGIEIYGHGARRRYVLKALIPNGTLPIDGKCYKSEEAARSAAKAQGLEIVAVGDLWTLTTARRATA